MGRLNRKRKEGNKLSTRGVAFVQTQTDTGLLYNHKAADIIVIIVKLILKLCMSSPQTGNSQGYV